MKKLKELLDETRTVYEAILVLERAADSFNLPIVCFDNYTEEPLDEVQYNNMEEVISRYPAFEITNVECDGKIVKIYG